MNCGVDLVRRFSASLRFPRADENRMGTHEPFISFPCLLFALLDSPWCFSLFKMATFSPCLFSQDEFEIVDYNTKDFDQVHKLWRLGMETETRWYGFDWFSNSVFFFFFDLSFLKVQRRRVWIHYKQDFSCPDDLSFLIRYNILQIRACKSLLLLSFPFVTCLFEHNTSLFAANLTIDWLLHFVSTGLQV
jgi:hypothetical protein